MDDSLPISSRDFASSLLAPAFVAEPESPTEASVTSEPSMSFGELLADASRDWASQPNAAPAGQPASISTPKPDRAPPLKPHETPDAPTPEPADTSNQAQELPPEVDGVSRKTDASPAPQAQPQPDDLVPTPPEKEKLSKAEQRSLRDTKNPVGESVTEHPGPNTQPKPAQSSPATPLPAPPPAEIGAVPLSPPTQAPADTSSAAPIVVGPPVLPTGNRSSALQGIATPESVEAEDSAHSAEARPRDASAPNAQSTQNRPLAPSTLLPSQPVPAPPAHDSSSPITPSTAPSAPSTNGATFLDFQPHAQTNATGGNSSAQPTTTSNHGTPIPTAPETRAETFSPQVVRGALAMTRSSGGVMTMRLEPESLGALRIQMQMSQGRVTVQFHAETAEARGLLNQHVQTLRNAMELHGLKLDGIQIHTLSRPGSTASAGQEQSQSQSGGDNAPRQDAGGQQSRGHADTSERQAQYRQAARQFMSQGQRNSSWRQQWNAANTSTNAPTPSLAGQP